MRYFSNFKGFSEFEIRKNLSLRKFLGVFVTLSALLKEQACLLYFHFLHLLYFGVIMIVYSWIW